MIIRNHTKVKRFTSNTDGKHFVISYGNSWVFQVTGMYFPAQQLASSSSQVIFTFSSASSVLVDYGDGTRVTYATKSNQVSLKNYLNTTGSVASNEYDKYTYATGDSSTIRKVTITVLEKSKLTAINFNRALNVQQLLPIRFAGLGNLVTIAITSMPLTGFDDSFLKLTSVMSLSLASIFAAGSRYYQNIPLDVLTGKAYTFFSWTDTLGNKNFADTNLDKIAPNLKNTLLSLYLGSCGLYDTNGTDGAFPANFSTLNITTLNITSNYYTKLPTLVINSLITLDARQLPLTSWGDLSGCPNLSNITLNSSANLPLTQPSWWSLKIRIITLTNLVNTSNAGTGKYDGFVTWYYNMVIAGAAMTGASTLLGRGIVVNISGSVAGSGSTFSEALAGTYQQPTGYVQGSNNGTPASSLERVWVLVNQYLHNWTRNT